MKIITLSLFPEIFFALNYGVVGRAISRDIVSIQNRQLRDYAKSNKRFIDDRPYGGGPGMVFKADSVSQALKAAKEELPQAIIICASTQGEIFNSKWAFYLSKQSSLIFFAGRYEGIDERVREAFDYELSIGNYVLTGGEFAVMVMLDSLIRLIPKVLSNERSALEDSFSNDLLDWPHYTRPRIFRGKTVPKELLSGNHKLILQWRLKQALGYTWLKRPELLDNLKLNSMNRKLLEEFINEMCLENCNYEQDNRED